MNNLPPSLLRVLQMQQQQTSNYTPYTAKPAAPQQDEVYRGRTRLDPLGLNKNPFMGAALNPFGEAFKVKSPAPMLDPIGYSAGWYKPGSKAGNMMNKIGDPLKIFRGLLG